MNGRRDFLKTAAYLALGGAAVIPGCASAGLTTYRYQESGKVVDLYLPWYPELGAPGGAIRLLVSGRPGPIIVMRPDIGNFVALSMICSHLGCTVDKESNGYRCPCHGSAYALDGTVVKGPAANPLQKFRTDIVGGNVKIFLE